MHSAHCTQLAKIASKQRMGNYRFRHDIYIILKSKKKITFFLYILLQKRQMLAMVFYVSLILFIPLAEFSLRIILCRNAVHILH